MFHPKKMIGKNLGELMQELLLMFCTLKNNKCTLLMFQNVTQTLNSNYSFNDFKLRKKRNKVRRKMALSCRKKLSVLLRGITSKNNGNFYCSNCLHSFRTKQNLNLINEFGEIKNFVLLLCPLKTLKYQNLINIKNLIKHYLLFMQILNV